VPSSRAIRPQLKFLQPENVAQVHDASLEILSSVGVRVDSRTAWEVFDREARVRREGRRAYLAPELVEEALQSAPSTIDIYDQEGAWSFQLGVGEAHFGVGVTALFYQDPGSEETVPFTRDRFRSMVRLGERLSSFEIVSTVGIIQDLSPDVADLYAVLELAANTTKSLVVLVSDDERFEDCLRLLTHLRGDLRSRPFVIPYFNPISPLVINAGTVNKMVTAIKYGLPFVYSNYGMIGATTPITPAGTLALLNAELLAGLTLSQLIRAGTPVVLGSLPASFDMRGMGTFYQPQGYLVNVACAEMMAHYGIPHCGTSGSGVGWGSGLVAAGHQWMNHILASVTAMELVPFVGDILGAKAFSPRVLVYADDVIREARRLAVGFEIDHGAIGLADIAEIGPGGTFLESERTFELFREAYRQSDVLPLLTLEAWQERGAPQAEDALKRYTRQLVAGLQPPDGCADLMARGESFIEGLGLS